MWQAIKIFFRRDIWPILFPFIRKVLTSSFKALASIAYQEVVAASKLDISGKQKRELVLNRILQHGKSEGKAILEREARLAIESAYDRYMQERGL